MVHPCWSSAIAIYAAFAAAFSPDSNSAQSTQELTITSRRPVERAIEAVENLTGDVITYEELEIVFAGDMDELHRSEPRFRPGMMVAPIETIAVDYEADPEGQPTDLVGLVRSIAAAAQKTDASLRFAMRQTGDHSFNVYAMAARDVSGKLVDKTSLLDTLITLPVRERRAFELFDELLDAVGAAHHLKLGLGAAPINLLMQKRTNLGASNKTARDFLVKALAAVSPQLSYSLLCQPKEGCMFNLHIVPTRTPELVRHTLPPAAPVHFR